ncbi:transcriptional repressor LexA [Candidatus Poriferisodalis sp.]|uniref:transcriptional repressor LexA n=1 Tax=Candidatus Poriferisodalis sp. TaxID=3101277 RepID=UPI003D10BB37
MQMTDGGGAAEQRVAHLGKRQQAMLEFIDHTQRERGYPPSVREIGAAVNLSSPATVHRHLRALEADGWLTRDPSRPRALIVNFDWQTGVKGERRPTRHVPLIGDVAAGTDVLAQQNVEELLPLPADFTGSGELFMLRVRGDSMIDAGIWDRDYVVARHQPDAEPGDIVVAGIDGDEGTVKRYRPSGDEIVLEPANSEHAAIVRPADDVTIYGKVVTVIRRV